MNHADYRARIREVSKELRNNLDRLDEAPGKMYVLASILTNMEVCMDTMLAEHNYYAGYIDGEKVGQGGNDPKSNLRKDNMV